MATSFKELGSNDLAITRTLLHESIPITGTIVSGTYADLNIKNYAHGMFQSVYDYPHLSSSANSIFDLTVGYSSVSALSGTANVTQQPKKINIYNEMAQVLVGFDETGSLRRFDQDGNILDGGAKIDEAVFINLTRLLTKDEVKKTSFTMSLATGGVAPKPEFENLLTISDYGASTAFKTNSPAGEYGILYTSSAAPNTASGVGLIYYQAGVVVLTGSVFDSQFGGMTETYDTGSFDRVMTGSAISASADGFRGRMNNIAFNNTTELNSSIYFCRLNHNEFNYSSNPTYLSGTNGGSEIIVKGGDSNVNPVSYITTIGLYSADNELLAVAKLSEPLKKAPGSELTLRVRLDF